VVTFVDEDARQKALKRLEDKITVTEREQAAQDQTPVSLKSRRSAITP